MTVDGAWSYVGSSNLDPRSLRLNFELDTAIYDRGLAAWIAARTDGHMAGARPVTMAHRYGQPFAQRRRNGVIGLASRHLKARAMLTHSAVSGPFARLNGKHVGKE